MAVRVPQIPSRSRSDGRTLHVAWFEVSRRGRRWPSSVVISNAFKSRAPFSLFYNREFRLTLPAGRSKVRHSSRGVFGLRGSALLSTSGVVSRGEQIFVDSDVRRTCDPSNLGWNVARRRVSRDLVKRGGTCGQEPSGCLPATSGKEA